MSIAQCIGRPRDKSRDIAIEKATVELLREIGYESITMDLVALRARVSKATIYRRWKNKAALVADAVHHYAFSKMPLIDTGSLRGDLIEAVSEKVKIMKSADGQLIAGLMCTARDDEDLAALLHQPLSQKASAAGSAMFDRAVLRGEIPADAKRELVYQIVPAVIGFRVFMSKESITRKFIENFVDDVLLPVLQHTSK
jgi:AcrR family transcriptional regulator